MLGLVLCGGLSSRMGTDKGLLVTEGNRTWARSAFDKLGKLGISVMVSINKDQQQEYGRIFPPGQLLVDDDFLSFGGPVAAILGAHIQYPGEDLFVLACDMPFMDFSILDELRGCRRKNPLPEAFVFTILDEPEPLCGIYTGKGLSCILGMVYAGTLPRKSMKNLLEQLPVFRIPVAEEKRSCFKNCNEK